MKIREIQKPSPKRRKNLWGEGFACVTVKINPLLCRGRTDL